VLVGWRVCAVRRHTAGSGKLSGEQILVVEDDLSVRNLLADEILSRAGYEIAVAMNASQALFMAKDLRPALVLLDVDLLSAVGLTILRELQSQSGETPVVLIATDRSVELAVEVFKLGVKDYILVPFNPGEVVQVVERVLRQVRAEQEARALAEELTRVNHLYLVGKTVTSSLDQDQVLHAIVAAATRLTRASSSALFLLNRAENELQLCAEQNLGEYQKIFLRIPDKRNVIWRVVRTGEPLCFLPGHHEVKTAYFVSSCIYVPLKIKDRIIGVMGVYKDVGELTPFSEADGQLLSAMAGYAAIAIENARLFAQQQHRLAGMKMLLDTGNKLARLLPLDDLLKVVIGGPARIVPDVNKVIIHLLDPVSGRLIPRASSKVGILPPADVRGIGLGEGIAGKALVEGHPIRVDDVKASSDFVVLSDDYSFRSLLVVPLRVGDQNLGTITVDSRKLGTFTEEHEQTLLIFANQAAIAIQNMRLYEGIELQYKSMIHLQRIAQSLGQVVADVQAVIDRVTGQAMKLLNVNKCVVMLYGEGEAALKENETLARYWETKAFLVLNDLESQPKVVRALGLEALAGRSDAHHSLLAVLRVGNKRLGVISVFDKLDGTRFDEQDAQLLEVFAPYGAIAVESAQQFRDIRRRYILASHELELKNQELERAVIELEYLRRIDWTISSTHDLQQVMAAILDGALNIIGVRYGSIMLIDDTTKRISSTVDRGLSKSTDTFHIHQRGLEFLATCQTSSVSDISRESGDWPWTDWYQQYIPEARSALSVPIIKGDTGQPIGVINVGSPEPDAFSEQDLRLLDALAGQAAIAIQNAQYVHALQVEQELRSEAEKIAAQADMAGNMVHRINNIAGAIRAYVQQIRAMQAQERLTDDYLDRKLGGIIENAERALEMARRICTPFQFQPTDTEPIDVKQMIVAALQELDLPPTIQVQRQLAPSLLQVKATGQLQEVFRNLIKNAWEAMGDQGVLTIRTWHSEDRKYAMASVADTGPGIEASQHEEIFRLGFGSKAGKGHLGYGLWWTRTFLKRLGGEIHLESQVGQGSTFTIVLPVVQVPGRDGRDGG